MAQRPVVFELEHRSFFKKHPKKIKNNKILLKKLLITVLHVPIILGIMKKNIWPPGGWPDTGIKVNLQYSFIYV